MESIQGEVWNLKIYWKLSPWDVFFSLNRFYITCSLMDIGHKMLKYLFAYLYLVMKFFSSEATLYDEIAVCLSVGYVKGEISFPHKRPVK